MVDRSCLKMEVDVCDTSTGKNNSQISCWPTRSSILQQKCQISNLIFLTVCKINLLVIFQIMDCICAPDATCCCILVWFYFVLSNCWSAVCPTLQRFFFNDYCRSAIKCISFFSHKNVHTYLFFCLLLTMNFPLQGGATFSEDEFVEKLNSEGKMIIDTKDPQRPRFTMSELREVLRERNELKTKLIEVEEELNAFRNSGWVFKRIVRFMFGCSAGACLWSISPDAVRPVFSSQKILRHLKDQRSSDLSRQSESANFFFYQHLFSFSWVSKNCWEQIYRETVNFFNFCSCNINPLFMSIYLYEVQCINVLFKCM